MKPYNKIALFSIALTLFGACAKDDGPDIDDHFLNYEIPHITINEDCPVGVFYYNNSKDGLNEDVYQRLIQEPDPASGKVGPHVEPVLGNYKITVSEEGVAIVQQHIDWCVEGGVDFLILPGAQEHVWNKFPNNINPNDTTFYNLVTGRIGSDSLAVGQSTGTSVNLKGLKYALSINMDGINSGLSNSSPIEKASTEKEGERLTRVQMFNDFYKRLSFYFSDPNYYKVDGKPLVVILNAHRLYAEDSEKLYNDMRAVVKEFSGYDMFLVAQQDSWSPPARFEYFYIRGKVDAVTHKNMYNQSTYDRSYWYPQGIDQNWIYSREFFNNHWNIDYIPTGSPSFNMYVWEGQHYNVPIVKKDPEVFRTMCNVMKKNLGKTRIVFIDSFNQWQYNSCLEPTKPEYGNGYGTDYLNIVKEQFKVNR